MFSTPILLITFNRPDHVEKSLTEIRKQQPSKLYIFQDGPRPGNLEDVENCSQVRSVINRFINWPCTLHTNYQEHNLGCGMGPYTAISWLFENEEYGIIMEDDIIPNRCFFTFMECMLTKYKDNNRMGIVTGHNLQRFYSDYGSYYFTYRMAGTWGWGTWKRVWKDFDFNIPFNERAFDMALKNYYKMPKLYRQRESKQYKIWLTANRHSYWDYQFDYFLLNNGYWNIRPNSCLTSNIGTVGSATHDFPTDERYNMEVNEHLFDSIVHPRKEKIDYKETLRMYGRTMKELIHIICSK